MCPYVNPMCECIPVEYCTTDKDCLRGEKCCLDCCGGHKCTEAV